MNAILFGNLGAVDLLQVFVHFLLLSMLAVGGAITTVPEMHRYIVNERGWLDDATFNASIALAQAAPGPNVMFVAVLGWNVGGAFGVLATLTGSMIPSATLALTATRWGEAHREARGVRAFTAGMAPLTIGLLLATSWILGEPARLHVVPLLLTTATALLMMTTKVSPMWPIGVGAVVGALGWAG